MSTDLSYRATAVSTPTWSEDLVTALLGTFLVGGVYLDGWAHLHKPGLETFFTPWLGVLSGGFLALGDWLA